MDKYISSTYLTSGIALGSVLGSLLVNQTEDNPSYHGACKWDTLGSYDTDSNSDECQGFSPTPPSNLPTPAGYPAIQLNSDTIHLDINNTNCSSEGFWLN